MSKHTPGPWIFSSGAVDDSNGLSLLKSARSFDRTNYRDLHLAAAAPELLEACKAAEQALADCQRERWVGARNRKGDPTLLRVKSSRELIRAAIAKAENGEP